MSADEPMQPAEQADGEGNDNQAKSVHNDEKSDNSSEPPDDKSEHDAMDVDSNDDTQRERKEFWKDIPDPSKGPSPDRDRGFTLQDRSNEQRKQRILEYLHKHGEGQYKHYCKQWRDTHCDKGDCPFIHDHLPPKYQLEYKDQ